MCIVENNAGEDIQFRTLIVVRFPKLSPFPFLVYIYFLFVVPPQISFLTFGEEIINSGDVASTQCTVIKGDLPIKISWLFKQNPIDILHGHSITKINQRISSLSIESVDAIHSGEYSCVAENAAGEDRVSTVLNVNGISF